MNRVVYASRGGNTKKVAEAVAKGAGATAQSVSAARDMAGTDTLFVGASIYAGDIDGSLRAFLEGLAPEDVKRVAVFGTSARGTGALPAIRSILAEKGIAVAEESFHCKGSFLFINRGRPNAEDLAAAEAFAGRLSRQG